jgi:hypothetical protein
VLENLARRDVQLVGLAKEVDAEAAKLDVSFRRRVLDTLERALKGD